MILQVRDLKVSFRTENGIVRVLDGVNFDVAEREVLGIVGESGSGKTVTMLAVMGLITDPNATVTGSIRFRGRELAHIELAAKVFDRVKADLAELAKVEAEPRLEGKQMTMVIAAK